jgi:hypothetical protein
MDSQYKLFFWFASHSHCKDCLFFQPMSVTEPTELRLIPRWKWLYLGICFTIPCYSASTPSDLLTINPEYQRPATVHLSHQAASNNQVYLVHRFYHHFQLTLHLLPGPISKSWRSFL